MKFFYDENGQGLVEYALILALISVVCMLVLKALGINVTAIFESVADRIANVEVKEYGGKLVNIDTRSDYSTAINTTANVTAG